MTCTPLAFTLKLVGMVLCLWAAVLLGLVILDRILIARYGQTYLFRYGLRAHRALMRRPFPGLRAWVRLGDTN